MKFFEAKKSWTVPLFLFILTNLVYGFMLMVTIPSALKSAKPMRLLDMMPLGYDLEYVNKLFYALGETGRDIYLTQQIPTDMIYPLLFGLTYFFVLAYFLKRLGVFKPPYIFICILPIIAAISDYIENIGIVIMLNDYPNIEESIVNYSSLFSKLKSTTTSICFIILIIVLAKLGIRKVIKK